MREHSPLPEENTGGAAKWLIGAAVAAVLLGGGYFAWQAYGPSAGASFSEEQIAASDPYGAEPPLVSENEPAMAEFAPETTAPPETSATEARPARRSTPRAAAPAAAIPEETIPEETIGVTPTTASVNDSDEIVVTAPRRPVWAQTPSARRLAALYPARALERGREGEARLHCVVQSGGALDCERAEESRGEFGLAALRVARTLRHAPTLSDGSEAAGSPVNLRIVFRMDDSERRRT